MDNEWIQDAYIKASNSGAGDYFGESVDIDGDYAIVGAYGEDNTSTSINNSDDPGNFDDFTTGNNEGAAYIFKRNSTSGDWSQDAYLKASNSDTTDRFGFSVAISGNFAIVGAYLEDGNATTVNNTDGFPAPDADNLGNRGAVYIFKLSGGNWIQDAYLKPSNTNVDDYFGSRVDISGNFAVVSATSILNGIYEGEDSCDTTINNTDTTGASDDNLCSASGAVYVYKLSGTNWIQDAYLKPANTGTEDLFGNSIAISGETIIVGAKEEDSDVTGITNGDDSAAANNDSLDSGAAYIFKRDPVTSNWYQDAYLKASNAGAGDIFGYSVDIFGDTAIVGSLIEENLSTDIHNADDATITDSAAGSGPGAAYVFKRDPVTDEWIQDAYLKASNTTNFLFFGMNVSINNNYAVVGTEEESSNATGITNADGSASTNTSAARSGAAYIFKRDPVTSNWYQDAYLKGSNANFNDLFGSALDINASDYIIVGAENEDAQVSTKITNDDNSHSTATSDNSFDNYGAVYIFKRK